MSMLRMGQDDAYKIYVEFIKIYIRVNQRNRPHKEIKMIELLCFPYLDDNFGLIIHNRENGKTLAVDAGESETIDRLLTQKGWHLDELLITHHHSDHIDGVMALKEKYNPKITAPKHEAISFADVIVMGGEEIEAAGLSFQVIATPGHSLDHIVFYCESEKILAAADTLFSLGCGRMFEGTAAQFWDSLDQLRQLPDDVTLYCGHEYTLANARFALHVDPDNMALQQRAKEVESLRNEGKMTLPVTLGLEKQTNPFLRVDDREIRARLDMTVASNAEVFGKLRKMKDDF